LSCSNTPLFQMMIPIFVELLETVGEEKQAIRRKGKRTRV